MIRSDRAKSNLLLFLLAFTSTFINVVQADQNSLCKLGEEIYFSCAAKGKMISLCGSQDASPADGYLVYRYGQAGALELEYPAGGVSSPSKSFTYGEWSGAKGGGEQTAFTHGLYRYTLYSEHWAGEDPREDAGVLVEKGGKRVTNIACTRPRAPQTMQYLGTDQNHFSEHLKPHYVGLKNNDVRCGDPFRDCY